jgi:hypothetical protein
MYASNDPHVNKAIKSRLRLAGFVALVRRGEQLLLIRLIITDSCGLYAWIEALLSEE